MKTQIDKKNLYKEVDGLNINYYSYNTLIAIATPCNLYCTDAKYSVTTSKHMNFIQRKLHPELVVHTQKGALK